MSVALSAPFPWFGGKSRAADLIWSRFGPVPNYVEPFAGSLAVLLARQDAAGTETVNDRDAYVANFWRATQADPEAVARFADWPVSEADLHARHVWLVDQVDFRERMLTDPTYFDAQIAGWWVWGISSWIGSGWCERTNERTNEAQAMPQAAPSRLGEGHPSRKLPKLGDALNGIHRDSFRNWPAIEARTHARTHARQIPILRGNGQGITVRPRGFL